MIPLRREYLASFFCVGLSQVVEMGGGVWKVVDDLERPWYVKRPPEGGLLISHDYMLTLREVVE